MLKDIHCVCECDMLNEVEGLEAIESLEILEFMYCKSLQKLPDLISLKKLIMHDQLRDLGRQIVFEEGKIEPWKRSRLWDAKDALQTLETCQGTSSINANSVSALHLEPEYNIHISVVASHFQNLPNLRYLHMDDVVDVRGDFNNLLPNLRWFRCTSRNLDAGVFFPENLNMKNLAILDLSSSVLRDDWDGWNKLKIINNLKYLNLSWCYIPALLDLSTLTKLVEIHLSSCYNLKVIRGLDNLQSLEILDASGSLGLIQIEGVQKLISLKHLNLESCEGLKSLRNVSYSVSRYEWDGWSKLKMINSLKYLNLSNCMGIPALLDLSNLTKLVEVDLSECRDLIVIQGLDKLQSLKRLDASFSHQLIQIEGVQKLISLEYLNLDGCESLKGLGDLSNLKKLQELKGALGLDATDFSDMKELKELDIIENYRIEIQSLYGLEALEELEFSLCPYVVVSPNLSYLKRLKILTISKCSNLVEIKGIAGLEMLNFLEISNCKSLERLTDLSACQKLEDLDVSGCVKLSEILGLEELKSLTRLDVRGCKGLRNLPNLSNVKIERGPYPWQSI